MLSFLSLVYLRNENWESFSDIFDGLAQLSEQNYEALFPARPRAKHMAFKWLAEQRYIDRLDTKKPKEDAYEHTKRLVESLTKLKKILEENSPEESPFPSGLFKTAQKWEKSTKPKPKQDAPASPTTPSGSSTTSATTAQQTAQATMENPKEAQTNGRKIAMFLIEKEPEKPMGYRLLRSLRWDLIEKAPIAENGKTRIQPPTVEKMIFFQNITAKGDWKKALFTVEKEFSSGPTHYWLDLQRIGATACRELGGAYGAVHDAICSETALFLKRIPEIIELSFSDGTPFCDNATKDWIDSEVSTVLPLADGSVTKSRSAQDDPLKEEKKEINALVSAGKTDTAVEILQSKIHESGSERINFKRSLILCNLLFSAKHADIALAILESLHEKIVTYNLDKWEPELAVEAWCMLVKAYKIVGSKKPQNMQIVIQEKQNSILNRISCIDPKSALKLNT